jgi:hypothetical protein
MYAQKLEGDAWIGERMDTAKIDKMSSLFARLLRCLRLWEANLTACRSAIGTAL